MRSGLIRLMGAAVCAGMLLPAQAASAAPAATTTTTTSTSSTSTTPQTYFVITMQTVYVS